MTGTVRQVNCTNCGAGLDVLGGGRVTTQVCGYCGAALDANDAYRVLDVFAGMERPASPFAPGMTGTLRGVEWTVTGTIGMAERHAREEWRWTDHMLHSPTHGYAWLTVEDGHVTFTRKVRDWPEGSFLDRRTLDGAPSRPHRQWRGRTFRYYESSSGEIDYVEGAFNFRPGRGDRVFAATLMAVAEPYEMLTYLSEGRERGVELTRYAPDAAAAFGVAPPARAGVHPLQPEPAMRDAPFRARWFLGMAAAAVAMIVALDLIDPPGPTNGLWLFLAAGGFGFAAFRARGERRRRWAGSDWDEA